MKNSCITMLAALVLILVACSPPTDVEAGLPAEEATAQTHKEAEGEVHWGYEGEIGPEHWADLSPEFGVCRTGTEQSPIDLTGATVVEGESLELRPGSEVLTLEQRAHVVDLVDNGHTIQVTNDAPLTLDLDGVNYELVQYHFHAPSEHTVDGEHAPLEVHFVHKAADERLAVVGILVEEGEHNSMWDPVIAAFPDGTGEKRRIEDLELDMSELRPLPRRFFRYQGSLTTPPCSEGVQWVVMAERRQISEEQMGAVVFHLHHNIRPVQPLGDRELVLVEGQDSRVDYRQRIGKEGEP